MNIKHVRNQIAQLGIIIFEIKMGIFKINNKTK